jgi:hypothetical protein
MNVVGINNNDFNRKKVYIDLAVIGILSVFVYAIASSIDMLENMYEFTRAHDSWELDELIPVGLFLSLALGIFAYRRWQDIRVLEKILKSANAELKAALQEVIRLRGILPICMRCKKIRSDTGYWQQLDEYVMENSDANFSHGVCPECLKKYYEEDSKEH